MSPDLVLEHRSSTLGRRAQRNRLWLALAIAAVEAVLVVVGAIDWWVVVLAAAVAVAAYLGVLRDHGSADLRTAGWIAAVSQLLVVLVPVVTAVAIAVAVLIVVIIAAGVLAALLLDRR